MPKKTPASQGSPDGKRPTKKADVSTSPPKRTAGGYGPKDVDGTEDVE